MAVEVYTQTTLAAARAQLAERLSLTSQTSQFWLAAELTGYITEALHTWNSLALYWRTRGTLNCAPSTSFYDLPSQLTPSGVRSYSVTDQSLYLSICYSLLEPASTSSIWSGSEMFTSDDLTQALQRRLNQLLLSTQCVLTHQTPTVGAGGSGRVVLDDDVIDVRRAAWSDSTDSGTISSLWPSDEHEMVSLTPQWNITSDLPRVYSISATPPLTLQLAPIPANTGALDLLCVLDGPTLNPTSGSGVVLGIPDDFCWVLRWGALADLLGMDGPARDPDRSAYCEARWRQGLDLLRTSPAILTAQIDGTPTQPIRLIELDQISPTWESDTPGQPSWLAVAGQNIVAVYPLADSNPHSLTFDLLGNMPIPASDTDYLQIGEELLDPLLDYAQHLAAFKMGGAEFQATLPHYERLVRLAALQNERLRASSLFKPIIEDRAQGDLRRRPRWERAPANPILPGEQPLGVGSAAGADTSAGGGGV